MKTSKVIIIALLVSAYATVSVINIELAKPKDVSEVTLDMLDVMSRAFDESEGGEGGACPTFGDVSYGGYEAKGVRTSNEGIDWHFSATIDGEFKIKGFPTFQQAHDRALELGLTVSIENGSWVEYNCDGSNHNICWVCNRYPLDGPGGDPS